MLSPMADKTEEPAPAKLVRLSVDIEHEAYVRLMTYRAKVGRPTKQIAAEWITERLAIEEAKLAQQ
jgi:hypothetical protein